MKHDRVPAVCLLTAGAMSTVCLRTLPMLVAGMQCSLQALLMTDRPSYLYCNSLQEIDGIIIKY